MKNGTTHFLAVQYLCSQIFKISSFSNYWTHYLTLSQFQLLCHLRVINYNYNYMCVNQDNKIDHVIFSLVLNSNLLLMSSFSFILNSNLNSKDCMYKSNQLYSICINTENFASWITIHTCVLVTSFQPPFLML